MTEQSTQAKKICVVDDDPFLLDMYSLKFSQTGYQTTCFTDSNEFLDSLRKGERYDVILLDIIMPKINGFQVLKTLREENLCDDKTLVIVLSNQGQDKDINQAKQYGIDGYLIKANTLPSEVLEYVQNLIAKKLKAS